MPDPYEFSIERIGPAPDVDPETQAMFDAWSAAGAAERAADRLTYGVVDLDGLRAAAIEAGRTVACEAGLDAAAARVAALRTSDDLIDLIAHHRMEAQPASAGQATARTPNGAPDVDR